ncbi:MAG: YfiR family protein [Bacteroidales bacterium]|jgi:hypothetical protein
MKVKSMILALCILISGSMKASENLAGIEAMFIYNFLRLIKWPDGHVSDVFVIGVYGNSETYDHLVNYTKGKRVGTKSIVVKKINSSKETANCQVVFVPGANRDKVTEIKKHLGNQPCLVVSEQEGMNANGSTIEFVLQDNKLKFRVNESRAKQQNLILSKSLIDMSV